MGSVVYRRINPSWWVPTDDGGRRITSQAFQDSGSYMSVALGVLLEEQGIEPAVVVEGFDGFGLAQLGVDFVRGLGLGVTVEVDEANTEPWHGGVHGKKTGAIRTSLAGHALLVIEPVVATRPPGS